MNKRNYDNELVLMNILIGGRISGISRICDLVCFDFECEENEISLHIQSFFRIMQNETVIISSNDIYRCGMNCENGSFEWDIPGNSVIDDSLEKYRQKLFSSKIIQSQIENTGDLVIVFENNIILQIFIDTTVLEEKYRIFDSNNNYEIVVNSY